MLALPVEQDLGGCVKPLGQLLTLKIGHRIPLLLTPVGLDTEKEYLRSIIKQIHIFLFLL